jgi:hypothetical protein
MPGARQLAMGFGHIGRARLVAALDEGDIHFNQRIKSGEITLSWNAENALTPLAASVDQVLGAGACRHGVTLHSDEQMS